MNITFKSKEEEMLFRVFNLIEHSHFTDFKMICNYTEDVHFPRSLGDNISNYIQNNFPEYYHSKRKAERNKLPKQSNSNNNVDL